MNLRQNVKEELLPFAERLASAVSKAGGLSFVSKEINKPRATIDRWMNAQAEPPFSDVVALASACGVALDWLAGRKESPTLETRSAPDVGAPSVQIPILDVSASAGSGYLNHNEEVVAHLPFPSGFLRALGVSVEKARMVRSHGDSMEPTIPDDRLVLINTADRDISRSKIFLVRTADGLRLKRILRAHDGAILLISDNKEIYPTERLEGTDLETFRVIGRAVWTERLL